MSNHKKVSSEAGRAYVIDRKKQALVEGLIKKHMSKYDLINDRDSDDEGITAYRCFKCLIGTHENDGTETKGHIFEIIEIHKPKATDNSQKTKEKLNSITTEFKKFVYRVKRRYRCDVIEKALRKYKSHKGKNEPLYSIQSTDGEEMELLRADYYKQLTAGYEANKKQITTAKKEIARLQKEHRRTAGELKQANQTISKLRENNRELKSKYKALLNQKIKERPPAPPISNASEIIHSDEEDNLRHVGDNEESEEADEEEQDESKEESDEEQDEESDEGEGEGEGEEEEGQPEGKRAIIEGEPDPPYLDEIEPGLFTPNI